MLWYNALDAQIKRIANPMDHTRKGELQQTIPTRFLTKGIEETKGENHVSAIIHPILSLLSKVSIRTNVM